MLLEGSGGCGAAKKGRGSLLFEPLDQREARTGTARRGLFGKAYESWPADAELLGCTIPRRHRSTGCRSRGGKAWSTSQVLLGDHHNIVEEDGPFHEDEREALEALCFLSAGSCQPPAQDVDQQQQQLQLQPQPPSKAQGKAADKQQHSKGSCTTAELNNPSSSKAAATSRPLSSKQLQLTRQNSPASDVSSGGCQASLVPAGSLLQPLAMQQQQQQHGQHDLPLPLEDIHPAALPDAGLLQQQLPATAATAAQLPQQQLQQPPDQQQQQQKLKADNSQQQTGQREHQQQQLPQPAPQQLGAAGSSLPGTSNPWHMSGAPAAVAPTGMPVGSYPGLPGGHSSLLPSPVSLAAAQQALLGQQGPADGGAAMAAAAFAALGLKQSPIQAQLASLMQPDLLQHAALAAGGTHAQLAAAAAMAAAAAGGAAPGLAAALPQLLLQQVLGLGQHLSGQQQGAAGSIQVKRPPVKGCYWHVYIANMIADKQREEEQQQQQQQSQGTVGVKVEGEAGAGGQASQQRVGSSAGGAASVLPPHQPGAMRPPAGPQQQQLQQKQTSPANSGSTRAGAVRKAEELTPQGSPTKRHKKQQQQELDWAPQQAGQHPKPADLLGLLNNSSSALLQASSSPAFGLAMAAAAAAAAGQPGALPLLPQLPLLQAAAPAAGPIANPFLLPPSATGGADLAAALGLTLPVTGAMPHAAASAGMPPRAGCAAPAPDWLAAAAAAAAVGGQVPPAGDLLLQLLGHGPHADGHAATAVAASSGPAAGLPACVPLPGIVPSAGPGFLFRPQAGAAAQQQLQQLHALKLVLRNTVGGEQAAHVSQHGLLAQ